MVQASYLESGADRVGEDPAGRGARQRHHSLAARQGGCSARVLVRAVHAQRLALRALRSAGVASRDGALFDRYQPVLVVAANPGLVFSEVPLLRTARRRGVRSMAIDPSWDNFTNKLIPVRQVDRLVVWNDIMKEQAIALHGYRAGRDPRRRRAAVRSALPAHADAARRRSSRSIGADPVAQADRADDDAAIAL